MDREMSILHGIIRASNARQKIIASNIANSDTPGYKARDIKFGDILQKKIKMITTDKGHVQGKNDNKINAKITVNNDPSWGDRNNVQMNLEMSKMTENSITHDAAVKLLNAKIRMFKSAIRTK